MTDTNVIVPLNVAPVWLGILSAALEKTFVPLLLGFEQLLWVMVPEMVYVPLTSGTAVPTWNGLHASASNAAPEPVLLAHTQMV
jgi:hypothetical protein